MAIRGSGHQPDRRLDVSRELDELDRRRPAPAEPGLDVEALAPPRIEALAAPEAPLAPTPEAAPSPEAAGGAPLVRHRDRIGVVVIHGIGDQKPGETLLLWAHSLLRIVNAWAATTPGVGHRNDHAWTADIDLSGDSRPFVVAEIPGDATHDPQTWVMTEAWWAARVSPPSLADMFTWLVPREMWRLIRGIFAGIAAEGSLFFSVVDAIFLPLFIIPATALVVLVYLVLRVVRLIPYKPLQEFALFKALDFFLVDWFGDLRILLVDRVQAASIRARAADAIQACRDRGCETVIVIGHSGGTIVGYTTLTDEAFEALPVRRLITLGQALGIGWRLGEIDGRATADRDPDHLYEGDRLARKPLDADRTDLQWYDFWATHDPAPAGGFATGPAATTPAHVGGVSTRVYNRMSLLEDHGAYWDNDEEFLLPVARLIDTAPDGADPATSRFFPGTTPGAPDERVAVRQARVKILQASWVAVMAAGALAIPCIVWHPFMATGTTTVQAAGTGAWGAAVNLASTGFGGVLAYFGITPPSGSLDPVPASLLGIALMAVAFWLVGQAASGIWAGWDRRERQIALQPIPAWRPVQWVILPLALCAVAALALLWFAGSGNWVHALPSAALVLAGEIAGAIAWKGDIAEPADA